MREWQGEGGRAPMHCFADSAQPCRPRGVQKAGAPARWTESLELRTLLSAITSPAHDVASVYWQGESVQATQGQWILRLDDLSGPQAASDEGAKPSRWNLSAVRRAIAARRGDVVATETLDPLGLS